MVFLAKPHQAHGHHVIAGHSHWGVAVADCCRQLLTAMPGGVDQKAGRPVHLISYFVTTTSTVSHFFHLPALFINTGR